MRREKRHGKSVICAVSRPRPHSTRVCAGRCGCRSEERNRARTGPRALVSHFDFGWVGMSLKCRLTHLKAAYGSIEGELSLACL